jgi:hypothetical protein
MPAPRAPGEGVATAPDRSPGACPRAHRRISKTITGCDRRAAGGSRRPSDARSSRRSSTLVAGLRACAALRHASRPPRASRAASIDRDAGLRDAPLVGERIAIRRREAGAVGRPAAALRTRVCADECRGHGAPIPDDGGRRSIHFELALGGAGGWFTGARQLTGPVKLTFVDTAGDGTERDDDDERENRECRTAERTHLPGYAAPVGRRPRSHAMEHSHARCLIGHIFRSTTETVDRAQRLDSRIARPNRKRTHAIDARVRSPSRTSFIDSQTLVSGCLR